MLPVVEVDGKRVAYPHLDLYACNGAVIVPVAGVATDADALSVVEPAFPGRDVVAVKATMFASRGLGPHCVTQQVPNAVGRSRHEGPVPRPPTG